MTARSIASVVAASTISTMRKANAWAMRRARERSTWVGLAAIAAAAGKSVLADHLTSAGEIVPMILGAGGAALAAASTSSAPASATAPVSIEASPSMATAPVADNGG